jgi:hypothetical protein
VFRSRSIRINELKFLSLSTFPVEQRIIHNISTMTDYTKMYDPLAVINDPSFKVLRNEIPEKDIKQNLACFYNERNEINLVAKPMPLARSGEVIVHVTASGICGSDVHFWKHGHIGDMVGSRTSFSVWTQNIHISVSLEYRL